MNSKTRFSHPLSGNDKIFRSSVPGMGQRPNRYFCSDHTINVVSQYHRELVFNGHRVSIGKNKEVLEMDGSDVCGVYMYLMPL